MEHVKKTTPKNIANRLIRLARHIRENPDLPDGVCSRFDRMLDGMLSEDYFGTEGQCDPRGDWRG